MLFDISVGDAHDHCNSVIHGYLDTGYLDDGDLWWIDGSPF